MPDESTFEIPKRQSGGAAIGQNSLWDLGGLSSDPIIDTQGISGDNPRLANLPAADVKNRKELQTRFHATLPQDAVALPIKLYSTDPKKYLELQQRLFQGGFYGATPASSIPWGTDPAGLTYDAYKRALAAAQQAASIGHPMTPDEIIDQGIKDHQAAKAAGPQSGQVIQLTDPAALRGVVQLAAQAALNRNLSKDEVDRFVQEFQAQQIAYGKQLNAAQADQTGKTVTLTQPDPTAQAKEFVEQGHPAEQGGELLASYADKLISMLNGG